MAALWHRVCDVDHNPTQIPPTMPNQNSRPGYYRAAGLPASLLAILLIAGGCGSSKNLAAIEQANDSITDARVAVRQADQRGARELSPMELRAAEQKLEAADIAVKRGELDYALMLADEAEVDAELAEISALSARSSNALKEIRASIKTIREEIQRLQKK